MSKKRNTRAKRYPYAIYYRDGAYLIFDLTIADYTAIEQSMLKNESIVSVSVGILRLGEIRAVIEQKSQPKENNTPANPPLPQDHLAWIYGEHTEEEVNESGI